MPDQMATMHKTARELLHPAFRLLLRISLLLAVASSLAGQEHFKTSLESAQKLFASGKDDEAGIALRSLIREVENARAPLSRKASPDVTDQGRALLGFYSQILASAHNSLGLIAARHEQFEEAAHQFTVVRSLQPDFLDADFNLGLALFSAKHYPEAAPLLEHAVSRNPSNEKFKKYLGLVLVGTEQYEKALPLLEQARIRDSADARVLMALGTALA